MNRFAVKIIFKITVFEGNHNPQFDQQIRLIEACNEKEAIDKATQLARRIEVEQSTDIKWKFVGVTEINAIKELKDGSSLYSNTEEVSNENDYLLFIKERVQLIKDQANRFPLFDRKLSF